MPRLHFSLLVLLCFALTVHAQGPTNALETARQLAAGANDNAVTLEDRQDALKKLKDAAQLFLGAGEKLEAARALTRAGRLQLLLNSPADAITAHNQALALLKESPSVEVEVDNLNGLASAYMLNRDKSAVKPTLDRALMLSEQADYTRGKAEALLTLSAVQNFGNHADALRTGLEALALWNSVGDKSAIANCYEKIADYYSAQNILVEATQNYEQALQIWRELGRSSGQANALIQLGYIDLRRAEWQSGISRFIQAQALVDEKAEPLQMGQISCGMAELYNEYGMPQEGITYYQRALDYYHQSQYSYAIWYATWGLGWTYYLQHKYSDALSKFQESLTYIKDQPLPEAQTREYMGQVYLETDDYPAALEALEFALGAYTRAGNTMETARVEGLLGNVYERQGQLARARSYYVKALATAERVSDPVIETTISHALGRVALKSGNLKDAEDYLQHSIGITEKLQTISTSRDLRTAFYGSVHDRYQTYIELLMSKARTSPSSGYDVRAFETSESARARSLAEFFRSTHASLAPGIDPELAQKERTLRQSLTERSEYRSSLLSKETAGRAEELSLVNAEISRLEGEYNGVVATINQRFPAYKQITQPVAWSLQRIQNEVISNDQTMLLEYSLGLEKSYAWAVTRNSIKVFELPGRKAINEAARKFCALLVLPPVAGSEDQLNQAAQELSQMILSPLAAELNKQVIIVAADGGLNYIPFQVLPLPSSNEPLVSKFEIINAPSASILGDLRNEAAQRRPATKLLAAFGDPVFQPAQVAQNSTTKMIALQVSSIMRWRSAIRDIKPKRDSFDASMVPQLFYAARELANLRELAGDNALVLSDVAATRESFLNTDLAQYAMLHLATHGIFDPDQPADSGLLLSTTNREGQPIDGFLRLQDIYQLRAPVQMVVLSACETALGRDVEGEGLIGVTRGFMYAGASSVVASLWKVDDAATAELMRLFYTNMIQHGMRPGEALRVAQNSIRQHSNWRSPYYWAAFTLQGEYSEVIKPMPPSRVAGFTLQWKIVVGVVLLLTLATLAFWSFRRRPA